MADWSMEPAAAWVPCDLQLTNWPTGPAVCSTGLPLEYGSTEIFGNCLQTSIPVSNGGKLVEYTVVGEYDTMETSVPEFVVDLHNTEKIIGDPILEELQDVVDDYGNDIEMIERKIHRYPASIKALNLSERYTVPMVVSIGPYYYGQEHLKKAEKVKLVAAYNCSKNSGHSVQEMYDEVVRVANVAWRMYDGDMMAHISHEDFLPMMFLDACFLVQYMLVMSDERTDNSAQEIDICSFFDSNDNEIYHDIMLLENQLPWAVVEAVMKFVDVPLEKFIDDSKGCLQDRKEPSKTPKILGTYRRNHRKDIGNYEPPHLLGLLRFYIVGQNTKEDTTPESSSISFSISAVELAEIGVTLKPSETTEIIHMGLQTTGTLFAELSLAPLSLDSARASWLINMAALELCMTSNFSAREANDEKSAVCSYLLLLAMLVDREEDVQELRTKRLLQGGGGLNNREALDFFMSVQSLRLGKSYVRIMADIETYRKNRRTRTSVHAFFYKNIRIIAAVLSAIVTIVSILGTLISLKNS